MEEQSGEPISAATRAQGAAGWSAGEATASDTRTVTKRRRRKTSTGTGTGTKRRTSRRRSTDESKEHKTSTARRRKSSTERPTTSTSRRTTKKGESHESKTGTRRKTTRKESTSKPKTAAHRKTTKKTTARKTTSRRKSSTRRGGLLEIIRKLLAAKLSGKENPILGPILEHLTKGVGLSADASQAVAAFAVGKLASGLITDSGAGGAEASAHPPSEAPLSSLNDLMARMTSDEQVDKEFVISSGLAGELSQQAGLDPDQAAASLAEVFNLLRGERGD